MILLKTLLGRLACLTLLASSVNAVAVTVEGAPERIANEETSHISGSLIERQTNQLFTDVGIFEINTFTPVTDHRVAEGTDQNDDLTGAQPNVTVKMRSGQVVAVDIY